MLLFVSTRKLVTISIGESTENESVMSLRVTLVFGLMGGNKASCHLRLLETDKVLSLFSNANRPNC